MENIKNYINSINKLGLKSTNQLLEFFTQMQLKKEEYFIQAGEYAIEIGFLEKGIIRAFYLNSKGQEFNKHLFVGPSVIGSYVPLITKQINMVAQQALTDCIIWKAPFRKIEQLAEENCEIERLRRKIAEYFFVIKEKKELETIMLNADKRYQIFCEEFPDIEKQIPQYHIASYLGISPTQLSRIRKDLKL